MRDRRIYTWFSPVIIILLAGPGCSEFPNPGAPTAVFAPGGSSSLEESGSLDTVSDLGTSAARKGRLLVKITDSPFSDAHAALVTFSGVSVHRSGGGWVQVLFAGGVATRTCDLKQLEGPTDVLGVGLLPAGRYTQVRLKMTGAALYFANQAEIGPCATEIPPPPGLSAPVKIPSGTVILNRTFTVPEAGALTMVLDFDGDRSIRRTGPKNQPRYIMRPVIRVASVQ